MENENKPAPYVPTEAFVVYSQKPKNNFYVEKHIIENGVFQAGQPLSRDDLKVLSDIANNKKNDDLNQCYPFRNILGFEIKFNDIKIAWIHPAAEVNLFYDKSAGFKTGKYYIPNIVFVYDQEEISVFAIKSNDILNPSEKTKLYRAPFYNMYDNGSMCMGNVKLNNKNSTTDIIHEVEKKFFGSKFTHTNLDDIVKGNIHDAYKDANFQKRFDENLLIEQTLLGKILR